MLLGVCVGVCVWVCVCRCRGIGLGCLKYLRDFYAYMHPVTFGRILQFSNTFDCCVRLQS
jgi:hypothetical protein